MEGPYARERRARVERPAAAVDLREIAARRGAVRVQEVLRHLVRVVGRLLVVVVVALEREPVEDPVGPPRVAGVARAIRADMLVGQRVHRVRGIRQDVRDLRRVRRPVRVREEQVDVGLDERHREERRTGALRDLAVVRLSEEAAHRQVEPGCQRLIHVHPEVLPVVALEKDEDAILLGVLERQVEVRAAAPLPDRDVVRVEGAVRQELRLRVVHRLAERVVGNVGNVVGLQVGLGGDRNQAAAKRTARRAGGGWCDVISVVDGIPNGVNVRPDRVSEVRVRQRRGDRLGPERLTVLVPHRHDQLAVRDALAMLGEDLHHTVRGIRPVQRRRRRALHYLDPLDVFGVDVCEAVVRDRAVHDDQRTRHLCRSTRGNIASRWRCEGGRPAQPDRRLAAGRAASLDQPHPRHFALERAQGRDGRRLVQLTRIHVAHREGELLGLGRLRDARYDDRVDLHRIELELEVLGLCPGGQGDLLDLGLVPDVARAQRDGLSFRLLRRDGERVGPGDRGGDRRGELFDRDDHTAERFALPARDFARDDRRLRLRFRDDGEQRHQDRGAQGCAEHGTPHR